MELQPIYTDKTTDVKIRFNTNFPKTSKLKWRVIINGNQHLVDEVSIMCLCYTSQDIVKGDDGNDVEKFHISCKPEEIRFEITNFESENQKIKVVLYNRDSPIFANHAENKSYIQEMIEENKSL